MPFFSVLLLGLAVSFDGFGTGFACGVRRMRIPPASLLIICLSSSFSVFLSMKAGVLAAHLLTGKTASLLGGFLLLGVGAAIIGQTICRSRSHQENEGAEDGNHSLCMLSSLLREPQLADFDCSGAISGKEAVVLGVALAMDAFAAGFGAAMMGFTPVVTATVVGVSKFMLLPAGVMLGRRFSGAVNRDGAAVISGAVLVVLGLANMV